MKYRFFSQQFLSAEGKYVPAVPIKGSICINIGNMMQKLTSDRLIAGVMALCLFFSTFFVELYSDGKVAFLESDYLNWVRLLQTTRGVHNPNLQVAIAHVRHFVWTSTKNEWNTQNAN